MTVTSDRSAVTDGATDAPDAPAIDPVDPAAYLRTFRGETLRKATTALVEGGAYVTTREIVEVMLAWEPGKPTEATVTARMEQRKQQG